MTEAQTLAASLPNFSPATAETPSSVVSMSASSPVTVAQLRALPERLNDRQLAMVKQIADCPPSPLPACDEPLFLKAMRMMSILPRKADDEVKAELRINLYRAKIGSFPVEALNFLASAALDECTFFPSIHECLGILARWKRNDEPMQAHLLAGTLSRRERQARFDAAMVRLARREMAQDEIDALPARWKDVAEARAYLWRCDCGSYVARPLPVVREVAA